MSKREYGLARYWKRLELIQLYCRLSLPLILSMAPSQIKWRPRQTWWLERLWRAGEQIMPAVPLATASFDQAWCSSLLGPAAWCLPTPLLPRSICPDLFLVYTPSTTRYPMPGMLWG